jgi:energy-coupling factor transporter ATP-binding protein EcfA2
VSDRDLVSALDALGDGLGALRFGLLPPDRRDTATAAATRLRRDLAGLRTRLQHPDAPLLLVVGGVTGGGKSTLVNTLAGRVVAATGVRRPTTTVPTLVHHPSDTGWFGDALPLPPLDRVELDDLPAGLGLLDAPDSDSVSASNRDLADRLLDVADVWLWVTTRGKYADEDSMAMLRRARDRGTAVATALTHLEAGEVDVLTDDFRAKLADEGLPDVDVWVVPHTEVVDQQLPEHAVFDLRAWLWTLAAPDRRRELRDRTVGGALAAIPGEVASFLADLDVEQATYRTLTTTATERYGAATERFGDLLDQGRISMRDHVLASWVDFIGTGRFQRFLQTAPDRLRAAGQRVLTPVISATERRLGEELRVEAADAVAARVRQVADVAAGEVVRGWLADPAGRHLLEEAPHLHRSSDHLDDEVAAAVRAWEDELRALVQEKGAVRKVRTQWASTAINATAASLMVAVFASTGGSSMLTGAELTIAGAGATVGQLVLERMLGSQNVRWLIAEAKGRLLARVDEVLDAERRRFADVAAVHAPDPDDRERIEAATASISQRRGRALGEGPA